MQSLDSIASKYLSERVVTRGYAGRVRFVARGCRRLTVESCNAFLRKRIEEVSSMTAAPERAIVMTLWRWAFDRALVDSMPRGLVKVRRAPPPVRAWTLAQCAEAVNLTRAWGAKTTRNGAPKALFLKCWLLLGYETGARQSDLWSLQAKHFHNGAVQWTQHKTGQPHVRALSQACQDVVDEMLRLSPNGTVLGWAMLPSGARRVMKRHLKLCGLSGSSKWLRRSGATHIEMAQPGKGRIHLGHKTVGLAERNYIDWAQVRRDMPQAPCLVGN